MLHVVCIKAGPLYSADYVNRLHDMVTRNLPEGMRGTFSCFTDDEAGINEGIACRPLPHPVHSWFAKLGLFKDGLFPDGDRILYFDLDTAITGPLDAIAAYSGDFAILRDFYRPKGFQSSVMAWCAGRMNYIWDRWAEAQFPEPLGGDQAWIESLFDTADLWQNLFPGSFVSYKEHCRHGIPKGSKVCVFHGHPRPHEVTDGWVPHVWKVGGFTSAELVVEANVSRETVAKNITAAKARPAKWLNMQEPHDKTALIVAGGPSLADELNSLRAHVSAGAEIFAVNGALNYLLGQGFKPRQHVLLDARPENAVFLPPLGHLCHQIYSSQCDPKVLDRAGFSLTLFHPYFDGIMDIVGEGDESAMVGGGTTCGLKAVLIAFILGYRKIHLYGFDSSYRETEGHAYPQPMNDGERVLDVISGSETFRCAPWMLTQVEDFEGMAPELVAVGCELSIHGTGLLPHRAQMMHADGPVTAADQRAHAILERIRDIPNARGAEIGVFAGDLSKRLLGQKPDLTLYMVDSWAAQHDPKYAESGDFHASLTQAQQDEYYEFTRAMTSFAGARAQIIRKPSIVAAMDIPRESLDFVFIDADHSYEGCAMDITAWLSRLKPGGILSGHDYENEGFPKFGVKRAVDEFCAAASLELSLGANYTWFVVKPSREAKAA